MRKILFICGIGLGCIQCGSPSAEEENPSFLKVPIDFLDEIRALRVGKDGYVYVGTDRRVIRIDDPVNRATTTFSLPNPESYSDMAISENGAVLVNTMFVRLKKAGVNDFIELPTQNTDWDVETFAGRGYIATSRTLYQVDMQAGNLEKAFYKNDIDKSYRIESISISGSGEIFFCFSWVPDKFTDPNPPLTTGFAIGNVNDLSFSFKDEVAGKKMDGYPCRTKYGQDGKWYVDVGPGWAVSSDRGQTFTRLPEFDPYLEFFVDPASNFYLIDKEGNLKKSRDQGATWEIIREEAWGSFKPKFIVVHGGYQYIALSSQEVYLRKDQ